MKHIPRKRFGQNFLTDNSVLQGIVDVIAPKPDDHMVEIGPGLAALTSLLLPNLKHMDAVELDRDLVTRLQNKFAGQPLTLHSADALSFDFGALAPVLPAKLRVVGNLPYNISSPLLFHLASFADRIQDQHFMLQKEVVERMVAEPGTKEFGRLSVMLQWRYRMELMFIVPPEAFDPPPKVESAIVRMIPLAAPAAVDEVCFGKVVAQAFSQRRKTIKNSLSVMFDETALRALGIDPGLRPEAIGVADYVALANALRQRPGFQAVMPAGEEPAAEQQGYPD